jgi:hypothetical protein
MIPDVASVFNQIISQYKPCLAQSVCNFDRSPTLPTISFEIFVVLGTAVMLFILSKFTKSILPKYLTMVAGVLIFEIFTAPMWNNYKLGRWAYVYRDVSWILTIGWSTLILSTIVVVDKFFNHLREWKRFPIYLVLLTILVFITEITVVNLGVRSYSPEVKSTIIGIFIFNVPIEGFYYIAVFTALVIGFYKYLTLITQKIPLIPIKKGKLVRNFFIALIGVFLFELMIEPMVVNSNLPGWSYIYRDISFLMTGGWIVIIWLAINIVDHLFINWKLTSRFLGYILTGGVFALPLESWLINNHFRIYGPSAVANFVGINTPVTDIPIEVIFAIPLYLALIISFIKYWETILDNKL